MRAKTFLLDKKVIVILENEHKEIYLNEREVCFTSFEVALHWVDKEVMNGNIHATELFFPTN